MARAGRIRARVIAPGPIDAKLWPIAAFVFEPPIETTETATLRACPSGHVLRHLRLGLRPPPIPAEDPWSGGARADDHGSGEGRPRPDHAIECVASIIERLDMFGLDRQGPVVAGQRLLMTL